MIRLVILSQFVLLALLTVAQSQSHTDSLQHLISLSKADTNKVLLLAELSEAYTWTKPDSCIVLGQQGLVLADQIQFKKGEAILKYHIGFASWILGNYLEADKMLFEALKYAESTDDTVFKLNIYMAITSNKRDKGDYRDALNYSFMAYRICNQCDLFKVKIGSIYLEMNNIDSALYYLKQAPEWGYTLWLLGETYNKKDDNEAAYKYYSQSISDEIKNKNSPKDLSNVYNSLAKLFKKENNIDSCIYYAKKAYKIAYKGSYTKGMWETSLLLSAAYEETNPHEALAYFKLATTAKDSLFNLQKTTRFLNSQFNEQLRSQEEKANEINYQNKIRTYILLFVLSSFLVIAFILYRGNRRKQKDKTEIEKAYKYLKSTQAQLIQSEKMASLGEVTAGIAHEIQNPLNFVNNFSEVNKEMLVEMKEEIKKGNIDEVDAIANDVIENEEKINHHGKRADAIVKNMLQHSRKSSGQKEPTDINALCDEYLRLSYHGMRAKDKSFNADFKTDFDETIGKINVVPQDIGRVFLNLFNNAFYALNEKKKAASENYKPEISVRTKKLNRKVEITLADNGDGIPQNIIDKIFQPFFTTKPTGEGTGLGLSLAYDIIKVHGGEIKVETNEEGEGTTFKIYLPAS